MSRRLVNFIADGVLTGGVIASLILADAPTWGWIGFGWAVWFVLKGLDYAVKADSKGAE